MMRPWPLAYLAYSGGQAVVWGEEARQGAGRAGWLCTQSVGRCWAEGQCRAM